MMNQANGFRVNNEQRKALVELAERRFTNLIEQAQDENGKLVEQITQEVKEELGITAIEQETEQLEAKLELLKKTKERLGFNEYGSVQDRSKASALVNKRTRNEDKVIKKLRKQRDEILSKIWLCQTIEETEKTLKQIPTTTNTKLLKAGGEQDAPSK